MQDMRSVYVLVAIVAALVIGLAVGAFTGGDDESNGGNDSAVTRSGDPAGTTGTEGSTGQQGTPSESQEDSDTGGEGTERAPESADDPRPEAPDDVIGDRPGGGGDRNVSP